MNMLVLTQIQKLEGASFWYMKGKKLPACSRCGRYTDLRAYFCPYREASLTAGTFQPLLRHEAKFWSAEHREKLLFRLMCYRRKENVRRGVLDWIAAACDRFGPLVRPSWFELTICLCAPSRSHVVSSHIVKGFLPMLELIYYVVTTKYRVGSLSWEGVTASGLR